MNIQIKGIKSDNLMAKIEQVVAAAMSDDDDYVRVRYVPLNI